MRWTSWKKVGFARFERRFGGLKCADRMGGTSCLPAMGRALSVQCSYRTGSTIRDLNERAEPHTSEYGADWAPIMCRG
jgi:hypothetical protein